MSKLLMSCEDYEEHAGISFYEAFVKPYEEYQEEMNRRRCAYCGAKDPFTKDHVMPKSRGGSDDKSNLVWCCMSCNARKHARTPEEAGMEILFVEESIVK